MSYKLFLDDYRQPEECALYMYRRIGKENPIYLDKDWVVVKNYPDFISCIMDKGVPSLISFDHDLADGHYHKNMQEGILNYDSEDFEDDDYNKTGYHCAKWLRDFCYVNGVDFPRWFVHSMNPVGTENIVALLK